MSVEWYFRFAGRTHFLLVPSAMAAVMTTMYLALWGGTEGGGVRAELAPAQIAGTLALFVLLPAYLLATAPPGWRQTQRALDELGPAADPEDVATVRRASGRVSKFVWLAPIYGVAFGVALNPVFVERMWATGIHGLDAAFVAGACFTWVAVGVILAWRMPTAAALSKLGSRIQVDLYRLDKLRPLSRIAITDVLIVAGAMAFTPLQSLDAEFRLGNYLPAILVGVPAAVLMFVWPIWGLRGRIKSVKEARLRELHALVDRADPRDVPQLEPIAAHVDRVRAISNWPVDVEVVVRLLGTLIIPPLAWAAAAVVENLVDRL